MNAACKRFLETAREMEMEETVSRKWNMPVLAAIARGASRFSELEKGIEGITPRALALTLKLLQSAGLIQRKLRDAYPPTSIYSVSESGNRLAGVLEELINA